MTPSLISARHTLSAERRKLEADLKTMRDKVEAEKRDFNETETKRADEMFARLEVLDAELASSTKGAPAVMTATRQDVARWPAAARGSLRAEMTYRPDHANDGQTSFLRDLYMARAEGDDEARARLNRNNTESQQFWGPAAENRDMLNASTTGGDFVPPLYLSDLYVTPSISHRPLADRLPKYPLPPTGTSVSIPKLASGISTAPRSDGGTVSKTDGVTATVTSNVNEIAGIVDAGRIVVMRSEPGLDAVIGATLFRRYNAKLEVQLLSGTGTAPEHQGFHTLTNVGSVTYTDGSPTGAALLPKVYQAIDTIYEARAGAVSPDIIVMAPRRASWLSFQTSTAHPLFQQGQLWQGFGEQNRGFLGTFAGLEVIVSPQVGTTYGAGTNQDEMIVAASEDFILSEGPVYARIDMGVLSGTGEIRYSLFGFSAFLPQRYPTSACIVSGTGLAAPTWS